MSLGLAFRCRKESRGGCRASERRQGKSGCERYTGPVERAPGHDQTHREREGQLKAVLDYKTQATTVATVSARVFADARRSFGATMDTATLQKHVDEVVALLWTDSPKVTAFIPLLALRELQARLASDREVRQV
jgi:hypothetical protein